jgi:hypothetical protein
MRATALRAYLPGSLRALRLRSGVEPIMRWMTAAVIAAALFAASCADQGELAGPSPSIVPDAATMRVGDVETFSVFNAAVRQFTVRSAGRPWSECVALDSSADPSRSIRVVATATCGGLVYISADIGAHRSPLVAAVAIRSSP